MSMIERIGKWLHSADAPAQTQMDLPPEGEVYIYGKIHPEAEALRTYVRQQPNDDNLQLTTLEQRMQSGDF